MKPFLIILFSLLFATLAFSQDTLYVRSFDDLGPALEKKLEPLEQLKDLPHENCNCEECMAIKNKVADEIDAIVLDVDIVLTPWQSRNFHKKVAVGMEKIEKLNKLGDKIRNGECLQQRNAETESPKHKETLDN